MPEVNVIIPCFNTHEFLDQTLESLRNQTFKNFTVTIVNDGSDRLETLDYLRGLPSDVKVLNQENKGLSAARNAGIELSQCEYVLPLDSDDYLDKDFIKKALWELKNNENISFCFSLIRLEGEASGTLVKSYNFFQQLFLNQMPYCMLIKKSAWKFVGGYDESMKKGYEDWEFNIKLGEAGFKAKQIDEALFHYRVRSNGMLLGLSSKMHGYLWREIQYRHKNLYKFTSIIRLWWEWKFKDKTYPTFIMLGLFIMHKLTSDKIFSIIFGQIMRFSHSRRLTNSLSRNRG
ncbi:glycosyltransferase family 2 protein [Thalassospira xiamenensis]|uniref:glycosyltransferase family 2 protein n=1 Tax=Thalassospira xiamenensis TaxID=220697 RepID=UPI003AA8B0EF